ncbi:MAG: hypothetical protein KHY83_12330, partial [Coriobacteriia bacterium]|nr:hypothetical protein [Coriobacteriia bacterium]
MASRKRVGAADGSGEPPKSLLASFAAYVRLPALPTRTWIRAMLPRVGIPVAFAVLYYVITRWPVGGDPANVAGVMDMVAAGLAAH